jgi:cell wall-associated NlpC family hydrolase
MAKAKRNQMNHATLQTFFFTAILAMFIPAAGAMPFPSSGPEIPGAFARLRYGLAFAPAEAPLAVKRAIWAANQLRSRPYRYGGGHKSFSDSGYDCSGTVSYVLGAAGLVRSPMSSTDLRGFGSRGRGKWITVYARNGHTFAVIAGLRLDTTAWQSRSDRHAPRWQTTYRPPRGFVARHPAGL